MDQDLGEQIISALEELNEVLDQLIRSLRNEKES